MNLNHNLNTSSLRSVFPLIKIDKIARNLLEEIIDETLFEILSKEEQSQLGDALQKLNKNKIELIVEKIAGDRFQEVLEQKKQEVILSFMVAVLKETPQDKREEMQEYFAKNLSKYKLMNLKRQSNNNSDLLTKLGR